jgi:ABC-type phosphonate transport system ATPase subunit
MMHGTQTAPAALAVSALSHFYGRRKALDDVTFSNDVGRAPGEALRVLGVVFQPRTSGRLHGPVHGRGGHGL